MAQSGAVFKTLGKLATIDYSSSKDYFVFTMRERRASQENKKRRRKSKTRRLSVTLKPERTSGKEMAVTREEESMDVDSCLPTDENSSRSKKPKEQGTGEIY